MHQSTQYCPLIPLHQSTILPSDTPPRFNAALPSDTPAPINAAQLQPASSKPQVWGSGPWGSKMSHFVSHPTMESRRSQLLVNAGRYHNPTKGPTLEFPRGRFGKYGDVLGAIFDFWPGFPEILRDSTCEIPHEGLCVVTPELQKLTNGSKNIPKPLKAYQLYHWSTHNPKLRTPIP